jgi:hypothetical protein
MAKHHAQKLLPFMKKLYRARSLDIQQCVEVTLYHWCNVGVISPTTLSEFALKPRDLKKGPERPLSEHEKNAMEKVRCCISSNSSLSRYIYPVIVIYGSKVKGYALQNTDNDIAFFIRPEVSVSDRNKVQNMLSEVLTSCNVQATPVEVWLQENNYSLQVRDIDSTDGYIAQSSMVYILLQSIWFGDSDTIQDLYQRLVVPYFTNEHRHTNSNRTIWLREMERDMLQYRLMHKGYARFYPTETIFTGIHTNDIDGTSTFWDSGYRKVATKLFISNVYLPLLRY